MPTLNEFINTVKSNGLAKKSKYLLEIFPPFLQDSGSAQFARLTNEKLPGMDVNARYSEMNSTQRLVSLFCETMSIPGMKIDTKDNRTYGPIFRMPMNRTYNDFTATFYLDREGKIRRFFDLWQEFIVNPKNNHFNFYKEYVSRAKIYTLDEDLQDGTVADKESLYAVELFDIFPTEVASMEYAAGDSEIQKVSVTFAYHKYEVKYLFEEAVPAEEEVATTDEDSSESTNEDEGETEEEAFGEEDFGDDEDFNDPDTENEDGFAVDGEGRELVDDDGLPLVIT
jgi:hypothetical protein